MKLFRFLLQPPGQPPGTLPSADSSGYSHQVTVTLIAYDDETAHPAGSISLSELPDPDAIKGRMWINVDGIHDPDTLRGIAERYRMHMLALEEIVDPAFQPGFEEYEDHLIVKLVMMRMDEDRIDMENVSILLSHSHVLTFQENPQDVFEPIRRRLRDPGGRMRRNGSDYLMYALIDIIVDNYDIVLEHISSRISKLEDEVMDGIPHAGLNFRVHQLKREIVRIRRAISPVREIIAGLLREDRSSISDNTRIYLRDVQEHVARSMDTAQSCLDWLSSILELNLSLAGYRMNNIMKTMALFSAVFLPLSFIAGVYGMNFEYIPELGFHNAYFIVLGIMGFIASGLMVFFVWRKWFK